ncbi:hypothetical protein HUN42_00046 [Streptomyces phage Dagobah]|nr:hypothetical protein HUN42_00046 [Streptomyces phage Dagobah]
MVRTKIKLEIESDALEDLVELVDQLRHGMSGHLGDFDFKVAGVQHLVDPEIGRGTV